ncbi:hypothetical protein GOD21_29825 [Sinorhizobium medicae]|nr:hypothetical protein [Sinorhizobium medicae]
MGCVEILGQERRRRWGDAKKLDVVMSIGLDGGMHRGGPQVQAFLRERRFHLVASASTLFRRLAASIAAGS